MGLTSESPNQRVEQNRRPALRCETGPETLMGYSTCVSPSPAAVAHPFRSAEVGSGTAIGCLRV
jgi:hypothetical protein